MLPSGSEMVTVQAPELVGTFRMYFPFGDVKFCCWLGRSGICEAIIVKAAMKIAGERYRAVLMRGLRFFFLVIRYNTKWASEDGTIKATKAIMPKRMAAGD